MRYVQIGFKFIPLILLSSCIGQDIKTPLGKKTPSTKTCQENCKQDSDEDNNQTKNIGETPNDANKSSEAPAKESVEIPVDATPTPTSELPSIKEINLQTGPITCKTLDNQGSEFIFENSLNLNEGLQKLIMNYDQMNAVLYINLETTFSFNKTDISSIHDITDFELSQFSSEINQCKNIISDYINIKEILYEDFISKLRTCFNSKQKNLKFEYEIQVFYIKCDPETHAIVLGLY